MINLILSFFNVGYFKYAPGTVASIVAAIIWFFIPLSLFQQIISICTVSLLGFFFCFIVSKELKESDPSYIVIDEVVGTFISLLFIPKTVPFYILSVLVFRFFDILKPSIIYHVENVKYGSGIMLDDILSGFFTFLIVYIIIH